MVRTSFRPVCFCSDITVAPTKNGDDAIPTFLVIVAGSLCFPLQFSLASFHVHSSFASSRSCPQVASPRHSSFFDPARISIVASSLTLRRPRLPRPLFPPFFFYQPPFVVFLFDILILLLLLPLPLFPSSNNFLLPPLVQHHHHVSTTLPRFLPVFFLPSTLRLHSLFFFIPNLASHPRVSCRHRGAAKHPALALSAFCCSISPVSHCLSFVACPPCQERVADIKEQIYHAQNLSSTSRKVGSWIVPPWTNNSTLDMLPPPFPDTSLSCQSLLFFSFWFPPF